MKLTRTTFTILALVILLALSACGPKATPGPVVLTVKGLVASELALTEADLHGLKTATISAKPPKSDTAQDYTGVRLSDLMDKAKIKTEAASMVMTASDGFSSEIDLATLKACGDCMIAFTETAGTLNAVMPGQSNKAWVKSIVSIEFK